MLPARQNPKQAAVPNGAEAFALRLQGSISGTQAMLASSLLIGCAAASAALYFYSRRYVGQLQYLANAAEPRLCFSVLDFWGHRQVWSFLYLPHTTRMEHDGHLDDIQVM